MFDFPCFLHAEQGVKIALFRLSPRPVSLELAGLRV